MGRPLQGQMYLPEQDELLQQQGLVGPSRGLSPMETDLLNMQKLTQGRDPGVQSVPLGGKPPKQVIRKGTAQGRQLAGPKKKAKIEEIRGFANKSAGEAGGARASLFGEEAELPDSFYETAQIPQLQRPQPMQPNLLRNIGASMSSGAMGLGVGLGWTMGEQMLSEAQQAVNMADAQGKGSLPFRGALAALDVPNPFGAVSRGAADLAAGIQGDRPMQALGGGVETAGGLLGLVPMAGMLGRSASAGMRGAGPALSTASRAPVSSSAPRGLLGPSSEIGPTAGPRIRGLGFEPLPTNGPGGALPGSLPSRATPGLPPPSAPQLQGPAVNMYPTTKGWMDDAAIAAEPTLIEPTLLSRTVTSRAPTLPGSAPRPDSRVMPQPMERPSGYDSYVGPSPLAADAGPTAILPPPPKPMPEFSRWFMEQPLRDNSPVMPQPWDLTGEMGSIASMPKPMSGSTSSLPVPSMQAPQSAGNQGILNAIGTMTPEQLRLAIRAILTGGGFGGMAGYLGNRPQAARVEQLPLPPQPQVIPRPDLLQPEVRARPDLLQPRWGWSQE